LSEMSDYDNDFDQDIDDANYEEQQTVSKKGPAKIDPPKQNIKNAKKVEDEDDYYNDDFEDETQTKSFKNNKPTPTKTDNKNEKPVLKIDNKVPVNNKAAPPKEKDIKGKDNKEKEKLVEYEQYTKPAAQKQESTPQKQEPPKVIHNHDQKPEVKQPESILKKPVPSSQADSGIKGNPTHSTIEAKPDDQKSPESKATSHMDKLKEQNRKLKMELKSLAKAADEALNAERKRRTKKDVNAEEPGLKEKISELKQQQLKIEIYKKKILLMKRQLENTYNLPKVVAKEDELKAAERELKSLLDEQASLMKIKKEQSKALDFLRNEEEYSTKLQKVTDELRQAREEHRRLNDIYLENDKTMKKYHERIIVLEEKCKDIQKKIKDKKNDKNTTEPNEITEDMVKELEDKIDDLQKKKETEH